MDAGFSVFVSNEPKKRNCIELRQLHKQYRRFQKCIKTTIKNSVINRYIIELLYAIIADKSFKFIDKLNIYNQQNFNISEFLNHTNNIYNKKFVDVNKNGGKIIKIDEFYVYETIFATKFNRLNIVNWDKYLTIILDNIDEKYKNYDKTVVKRDYNIDIDLYKRTIQSSISRIVDAKFVINSSDYEITSTFKNLKKHICRKILLGDSVVNSFLDSFVECVMTNEKL